MGALEDEVAGMSQVLVKAQPRKASAQQARKGRLARPDRFAPKVRAVNFNSSKA